MATRPRRLAVTVAVALALLAMMTVQPSAPARTSGYIFGTLNSQSQYARPEYAAGLRAAELVVGWREYEPRDGVFSDVKTPGSYAAQIRQRLQTFKTAGLRVILDAALQYPPDWVYSYPNSTYVNQYGASAPGNVNLTFNQTLRSKAAAFLSRLNTDLGLNSVWALEVGSGPQAEVTYPAETAGGNTNGYWAYDANAQGTAGNLPHTLAPNPFPGWKPGQTTYQGQPFSTAQVGQWMDWYLGALMDGVNWQISTYRSLGFAGYIHVKMPGWGTRPNDYATAIANYLDGAGDSLATNGVGAVWNRDIDKITDRQNVVIDISSVDDSTSQQVSSMGANLCRPTDSNVDVDDPQIEQWSSTRWISYNAKRYGMLTIGENPSRDAAPSRYGVQMMRDAAALMQACGLRGLLWAFDSNLYDGVSGVTLSDYADVIAQYAG